MNKRQAQRLLRVAKALRESPVPQAFTMGAYVLDGFQAIDALADAGVAEVNYDTDQYFDKTGKLLKEENFCGTPACALGHYGVRGDLQRLMKVGHLSDNVGVILLYHNNREVSYDDRTICKHFGITSEEAEELFNGCGCGNAQTPIEAAKYIEKFVRETYGRVSL